MPRRSSVAVVAFLCAAASLVMAQQPVPSAAAGDAAIAASSAPRAAAAPDPVPAPIVGAMIGGTAGTLVLVGGGIAGLFGLYQYLQ